MMSPEDHLRDSARKQQAYLAQQAQMKALEVPESEESKYERQLLEGQRGLSDEERLQIRETVLRQLGTLGAAEWDSMTELKQDHYVRISVDRQIARHSVSDVVRYAYSVTCPTCGVRATTMRLGPLGWLFRLGYCKRCRGWKVKTWMVRLVPMGLRPRPKFLT